MEADQIVSRMKSPGPADEELIGRALHFAQKAHAGETRLSGEPYINHPIAVAEILADNQANGTVIAAGLLHDVLENTAISPEIIRQEFGDDILFLIEGVTKLGKLRYHGIERHVESLRKFFIAMAKDARVVLIRLADRLHNIQTLKHIPAKEKQYRIALETLEIYAPLANRLGMGRIKGELEDASFPFIYPDGHASVLAVRRQKSNETIERLKKIHRALQKKLAVKGIRPQAVDYRLKHLYSFYKKLLRNNMDIDQIYDLSALRIIVDTVEECYQVLGIIHGAWRPLPGLFKDYIATPKPNGYQSIHTTVFTGDGSVAEIQIRTLVMHEEAEYGIASHVAYEESGKPETGGRLPKQSWVNQLLQWQKQAHETGDFLQELKTDFLENRIFVFTPKGDVIELPEGATVIDFAFTIHSEIGARAAGAKVNGKYVSLDHRLGNNDIVEVITKKNARPTSKWLPSAKTQAAQKHIRAAIGPSEKIKTAKIAKWHRAKKQKTNIPKWRNS